MYAEGTVLWQLCPVMEEKAPNHGVYVSLVALSAFGLGNVCLEKVEKVVSAIVIGVLLIFNQSISIKA